MNLVGYALDVDKHIILEKQKDVSILNVNYQEEIGDNMIIVCPKCNGKGKIEQGALFTGKTSSCKICGFQALGMTQVKQFEKRGNLCRECSGDYTR